MQILWISLDTEKPNVSVFVSQWVALHRFFYFFLFLEMSQSPIICVYRLNLYIYSYIHNLLSILYCLLPLPPLTPRAPTPSPYT